MYFWALSDTVFGQDLNAQIAQATKDRDEKAESKAKALQAKATATGDLRDIH